MLPLRPCGIFSTAIPRALPVQGSWNLHTVRLLQNTHIREVQVDPRRVRREVVLVRLHRVCDEVELRLVRTHEPGLDHPPAYRILTDCPYD